MRIFLFALFFIAVQGFWAQGQSDFVDNISGYEQKKVPIEMVFVRGGSFMMGCTKTPSGGCLENETPHRVYIDDFYIGKYEVTQQQWLAVMGKNLSSYKGDGNLLKPVEMVSWVDCRIFVEKLSIITGRCYRLPTEAEWEYAARGGRDGTNLFYSGSDNIEDVAWYDDNNTSPSGTKEVGKKSPNELGLYDMSGNVWEWCLDMRGDYSIWDTVNPRGACSGDRVIRGGYYAADPFSMRVSFRSSSGPSHYARNDTGLRLVVGCLSD
ncbi:MAG: formylglycine-generating enzyme family protein [Bacteroidales bacterium]|jgi:formylglycine-generating enzyme required for sulfatase activity|nr:formylglycine-generating enzyme family protein [Bacteroidales bacterium]